MIDEKKLKKIKKEIALRFPDFKDVEPKIIKKVISPQKSVYRKLSLGTPKGIKEVYSLQFKKTILTVDAVKIKRILVVSLNEEGEIIKISQSR